MPWALGDLDLGDDVLEIGPGPGLGTDALKLRCERLSSIEVDQRLAEALAERMHGSNVTVLHADATDMPFEDTSFSGAVAFTMLHHVPSRELQDRLFSEAHRVLRPGAYFVGTDSVWSPAFALVHLFDTLVPVDPDTLEARLESVGFEGVSVRRGGGKLPLSRAAGIQSSEWGRSRHGNCQGGGMEELTIGYVNVYVSDLAKARRASSRGAGSWRCSRTRTGTITTWIS